MSNVIDEAAIAAMSQSETEEAYKEVFARFTEAEDEQRERIMAAKRAIYAEYSEALERDQILMRRLRERQRQIKLETRQREGHPMVGKRLYKMKSRGRRVDPLRICGVVEICTEDSQFAENLGGRPMVGQWFVRVLKKDGTPSLLFEKMYGENDLPYGWRVEEEADASESR